MKYMIRLKEAMLKVEDTLFPGEDLEEDVESWLDRLKEFPS